MLVAGLCALSACNSKYVEESPSSGVSTNSEDFANRIVLKQQVDIKIRHLREVLEYIHTFANNIAKLENAKLGGQDYTSLDFLIDMVSQSEKTIPDKEKTGSVRYGRIQLPVSSLPEDCQFASTKTEDQLTYDQTDEQKIIKETISYSVKSCNTGGKYLNVMETEIGDNGSEIQLNGQNISKVINKSVIDPLVDQSTCDVSKDADQISNITCKDIRIDISQQVTAKISRFSLNRSGDPLMDADFELIEKGNSKGLFNLSISQAGTPRLKKY